MAGTQAKVYTNNNSVAVRATTNVAGTGGPAAAGHMGKSNAHNATAAAAMSEPHGGAAGGGGGAQDGSAPPPYLVGNSFIQQYYTVLHKNPRNLYRFYTEASYMTLADGVNETSKSSTVSGQAAIHNKVMRLGYDGARAEILSVDSQSSLEDGIIVQVTGSLKKNGSNRSFVQTFFLAVQEKGYYVRNDIFRYLDHGMQAGTDANDNAAGAVDANHKKKSDTKDGAATQHHAHAEGNGYNAAPAADGGGGTTQPAIGSNGSIVAMKKGGKDDKSSGAGGAANTQIGVVSGGAGSASGTGNSGGTKAAANADAGKKVSAADADRDGTTLTVDSDGIEEEDEENSGHGDGNGRRGGDAGTGSNDEEEEDSGPKTYAMMLKRNRSLAAAAAAEQQQQQQVSSGGGAADDETKEKTGASLASSKAAPKDSGAPCTALFARNLPTGIDEAAVVDVFRRFGTVKGGAAGVLLKVQKSGCYAFIEYEEASSVRDAIAYAEANPLEIGGNKVSVEEKKPMASGRNERSGDRERGERSHRRERGSRQQQQQQDGEAGEAPPSRRSQRGGGGGREGQGGGGGGAGRWASKGGSSERGGGGAEKFAGANGSHRRERGGSGRQGGGGGASQQ